MYYNLMLVYNFKLDSIRFKTQIAEMKVLGTIVYLKHLLRLSHCNDKYYIIYSLKIYFYFSIQ